MDLYQLKIIHSVIWRRFGMGWGAIAHTLDFIRQHPGQRDHAPLLRLLCMEAAGSVGAAREQVASKALAERAPHPQRVGTKLARAGQRRGVVSCIVY